MLVAVCVLAPADEVVSVSFASFPELGLALTAALAALAAVLLLTRQARALRSLRESRTRLAQAQALAHIGSWDWDVDANSVTCSEEGQRIYGLDASHFPMSIERVLETIHPDDRERVGAVVQAVLDDARPFSYEVRIVRPDGEIRSLFARGDVELRGGRVVRVHGTNQDITERRALEAQLDYQADHDQLTGLPNRVRFATELDRVLRYAIRYRRPGAVVLFDVDNLNTINDALGHLAGDDVLKAVAEAIDDRVRGTDVMGRVGGDEFAIVLPEAGEVAARDAAERIRATLAAHVDGSGAPLHVSAGIALFGTGVELVADDVLIAADIALHEAKERGRNQVRVYRGEPGRALAWIERIRRALADGRLVLHGQPILDLRTGHVARYELLIRMHDADGSAIPPSAFLPIAERFGLSSEIDRWVVAQGLAYARAGQPVSINLSAASIGDAQILALVREAVADGLDPAGVIFEITETAALTNMSEAQTFAAALTALGYDLALDDFGTGFGSFSYLKHLSTRYLKVDVEFVREMVWNTTDQQVVKAINSVAHSLGKQTIAEGVEDEGTLAALRAFGVDFAQGFYVGRPVAMPALAATKTEAPAEAAATTAVAVPQSGSAMPVSSSPSRRIASS